MIRCWMMTTWVNPSLNPTLNLKGTAGKPLGFYMERHPRIVQTFRDTSAVCLKGLYGKTLDYTETEEK